MLVGCVVNPTAGSGRMGRKWPEVSQALKRHFPELRIEETRASGDACALARKFAIEGVGLVIAAGGDGTVSEVVDGLLEARDEGAAACELGVVPIGTGSDLARSLGLSGDPVAVAARIASATARKLDAGRVDFIDDHGALCTRHFVNIASFGLSGPTARAVNQAKRESRMSGKALFLWHTIREIIRYRFQHVRVTVDGGEPVEGRIALVAVANGRYFGGGMMIAPEAAQDDGLAEVVIVLGTSKLSMLKDLRLVYSGSHRGLPSCRFLRGRKVTIEPVGDALLNGALVDIDGESPGRIPATVEMLPGALQVRC